MEGSSHYSCMHVLSFLLRSSSPHLTSLCSQRSSPHRTPASAPPLHDFTSVGYRLDYKHITEECLHEWKGQTGQSAGAFRFRDTVPMELMEHVARRRCWQGEAGDLQEVPIV
jgi:hypothetical protein